MRCPSSRLSLVLLVVVLGTAAACSPQTGSVDGGAEDLSQTTRDLASCEPVPGNLLGNPGFEQPSPSGREGNGEATNRGNPASTIPGNTLGPWDGCCDQGPTAGGTSWTIRTTMPRCGSRSVTVSADRATGNVLSQHLDLAGYAGQNVRATAWVFVAQALSGAQLGLDLFDLTTGRIVASSPVLTTTTADWRFISLMAQVPTGGAVQLRINGTGTFSAVVDDLALAPQ